MKVKGLLKSFTKCCKKRAPEILVGFGIAGTITTTILAVKATPKAMVLIDEVARKDENDVPTTEPHELTKTEIVKAAWKPYIPALISFTISTGCLIGASSVNFKRNAALATAYELSRSALTEYRDKIVETIGENEEKKIRTQINQKKIEKLPVKDEDVIPTNKGNILCFDPLTGRYFRSDPIYIKTCVNELNRILNNEIYVSLNTFYSLLGLKESYLGRKFGWNVNYDSGKVLIDFTSQLGANDEPCAEINYITEPVWDYDQYW